MEILQEMVFLSEIVLQVKIARRANERLILTKTDFDNVEVWCSIQSILVAAGNVSKILWPTDKYKLRGEKLRKQLRIKESNILASRKFRNHFEHYDERIEDWFNKNSNMVYTDLSMNPFLRGKFSENDHRGYNSINNTLIFRGEIFNLTEVINSLEEIYGSCKPYVLT